MLGSHPNIFDSNIHIFTINITKIVYDKEKHLKDQKDIVGNPHALHICGDNR